MVNPPRLVKAARSLGLCLPLLAGPSFARASDSSVDSVSAPASITEKAKTWWAFQPVKQLPVPRLAASSPIDAFIDEGIAAAHLAKAPPAAPASWLRRATFDLTGLPPSPAEVTAFLQDRSPDAFARVVDRLLASPAYGPRWARHWLDVVRYADYHDADAKARTASCEPLEAWRYRDWVVEAFNRDLPFDQFIVHQIAGDLLPNPTGEPVYPAGLIATAFLVNGAWDRGDADKEKMVSDMVDDQIDTVGKAFLGLTLGCARCHDHKFDPISNHDYYALAGMFYSSHFMKELGAKGGEVTLLRVPLVPAAVAAVRDGRVRQLEALKAKLAELDKRAPPMIPSGSPSSMNAMSSKPNCPHPTLWRWPCRKEACRGDSFPTSRTCRSMCAAATRVWAPWCRVNCPPSSPAPLSRRSGKAAGGGNWPPGSRPKRIPSPRA
jgi:hypothetical protein